MIHQHNLFEGLVTCCIVLILTQGDSDSVYTKQDPIETGAKLDKPCVYIGPGGSGTHLRSGTKWVHF